MKYNLRLSRSQVCNPKADRQEDPEFEASLIYIWEKKKCVWKAEGVWALKAHVNYRQGTLDHHNSVAKIVCFIFISIII